MNAVEVEPSSQLLDDFSIESTGEASSFSSEIPSSEASSSSEDEAQGRLSPVLYKGAFVFPSPFNSMRASRLRRERGTWHFVRYPVKRDDLHALFPNLRVGNVFSGKDSRCFR